MSASDSDCSIDWLASDADDDGVFDSESDRQSRPSPVPQHSCCSSETPPSLTYTCTTSEQKHSLDREHFHLPGDWCNEGVPSSCNSHLSKSDVSWKRRSDSGLQEAAISTVSVNIDQSECLQSNMARQTLKRKMSTGELEQREGAHTGYSNKDEMFAHKCLELQCYIQPLSSILIGLRSGRYSKGLSSFQESVAMDRIQRIMGVLQNPHMGERYIKILLQVEVMLKNWFPRVGVQVTSDTKDETTFLKKQKMSTDTVTSAAAVSIPKADCALPNILPSCNKTHGNGEPAAFSATNFKWLHTSPVCSSSVGPALGRHRTTPGGQDVMQDNMVSSSTDARTNPSHCRPPAGKMNAPCLERLLKSRDSIISGKGKKSATETSGSL
ncbi:CIART protein, partial [Polyodon spathula]|nr:CIART protein [Polyodon spathula]